MDYNGWANRSTWLVNLWIDNEYATYKLKENILRDREEPVTARWAQSVGSWFLTETVARGAITDGCDLSEVDWQEIADSWESERLEIHEHHPNYSARLERDGMF